MLFMGNYSFSNEGTETKSMRNFSLGQGTMLLTLK